MTIASEISRLQTAKVCMKAAIEGKGVSVPNNLTLDGYYACINEIETIPKIDFLVVGGGGGAAQYNGNWSTTGGGGGGGFLYCEGLKLQDAQYAVTVGGGGSAGSSGGGGGVSCFGSFSAGGGGSGQQNYGGGDGGGGTVSGSGGGGRTGGGNGSTKGAVGGGGGAGADANGFSGGIGCYSDITGQGHRYAEGGNGANWGATQCGLCKCEIYCGKGGNSGTCCLGQGGIVVVRYKKGSVSATGGCKYDCGSYTIHCFTSNGTLTIN